MASIKYETTKCGATIELNGKATDILQGCCRIATHVKAKLKMSDEDFMDAMKDGMEVCELERKVNDGDIEDGLEGVLKLLEKLIRNHKESEEKDA